MVGIPYITGFSARGTVADDLKIPVFYAILNVK